MAVFVAVLGSSPPLGLRASAPWGSWATLPWHDPTVLATDADVTAPETTHVLVLVPSRGARRGQAAAATVAAVRPDLPVHVEVLPVSTAVLVRALEVAPRPDAGPTELVAALTQLVERTVWGAWLPSVTKLERPAPTLGQHVQSWVLRGAGFLAVHGATAGDAGWVAKLPLDQVEPARRLPRLDGGQAIRYEAHVFGDLPEDAIAALFALGVEARPARRDPLNDAAEVWGTARAAEFVITPSAGATRGAAALGTPAGRCPSCAESVWGRCCPFCRTLPSPDLLRAVGGAA